MINEKILSDMRKVKLLIVEDNEDIIKLIDNTFKMLVSEIKCAKDGREGVEAFKEFNPDIILTDLRMPHCNGEEMMKQIREIDKEVPIIVISAYIHELEDKDLASYIYEKPIDFKKLLLKIDELISKD